MKKLLDWFFNILFGYAIITALLLIGSWVIKHVVIPYLLWIWGKV